MKNCGFSINRIFVTFVSSAHCGRQRQVPRLGTACLAFWARVIYKHHPYTNFPGRNDTKIRVGFNSYKMFWERWGRDEFQVCGTVRGSCRWNELFSFLKCTPQSSAWRIATPTINYFIDFFWDIVQMWYTDTAFSSFKFTVHSILRYLLANL